MPPNPKQTGSTVLIIHEIIYEINTLENAKRDLRRKGPAFPSDAQYSDAIQNEIDTLMQSLRQKVSPLKSHREDEAVQNILEDPHVIQALRIKK